MAQTATHTPRDKGIILELMTYIAAYLKEHLGVEPPNLFEIEILGMVDAELREEREEALAIRARRAQRDDADSRAIVAYLDALI